MVWGEVCGCGGNVEKCGEVCWGVGGGEKRYGVRCGGCTGCGVKCVGVWGEVGGDVGGGMGGVLKCGGGVGKCVGE